MNHHSREVGTEELPQLASGGVDDSPTALIEVEILEESEIEISNLKVEDEIRDFHSLDKSWSEDSVVYPEPFTEKDDEKKLKEKHERQMESERHKN